MTQKEEEEDALLYSLQRSLPDLKDNFSLYNYIPNLGSLFFILFICYPAIFIDLPIDLPALSEVARRTYTLYFSLEFFVFKSRPLPFPFTIRL